MVNFHRKPENSMVKDPSSEKLQKFVNDLPQSLTTGYYIPAAHVKILAAHC